YDLVWPGGHDVVDDLLLVRARHGRKGELCRPEGEGEDTTALHRAVVVVALLRHPRQIVDLGRREAEPFAIGTGPVVLGHGGIGSLRIREKDRRGASRDDGGLEQRVARDIGGLLSREHDEDVLLPERLEPTVEPGRKGRVEEKTPGLVQN